ncbi:putative secreted protein (Por secretion system target) [Flavobacterium endophyticum]|uniref:Putative secreted protein (Por secretion system target) n=1 Tax=Flavobacterium endophyticum TaxID=1540163 RepID=A0A495MB45_9FLAO|nr:T9SS type A sorting domain-containing protein [Flavobacterium endophyticum]RKS21943.1 putative secreted protein (Por secretion system target) [Flavobacterium endophyticum]
MKTNFTFFKACLFFMICLLTGVKSEAQTMQKGDIAFIGYNTSGPDGFAFIALNDLPAGETLYLTEQGWDGDEWMTGNGEPHLSFVIPSGITCGKIISVVETSADVLTVTGGGAVTFAQGTGFNLSGGDQMIAYQSTSGVAPASPIFIAAIHADFNSTKYDPVTTWNPPSASSMNWATSDSAVPTGLTNGVDCISLFPAPGPELANAKYNGTLTGTSIALRAAINNPANWVSANTPVYGITPASYPTPSVTCINCTNPTVPTLTASTATLCNGSSRTITITGTLNSATAWHVYSGSCGGTPVTSTSTGSFTVSPTVTTTYYVRGEGGCVTPGSCASITVNVNPAIVLTSGSFTTVSCNGGNNGTATVAPTGGTGPYTYSWAPSGGTNATAAGLAVGVYTVTVTDNIGCTATRSFTITQPPVLNGTTTVTNVACFGGNTGAINLTPSGGVGPYTFNWGGGITTEDRTGLTAGTYSVTITDANSCTRTISNIAVGQPAAAISGTTVVTNVACFGGNTGAINLTPTGGVGPYTFNWVGGATTEDRVLLTAGTYSVTITDANGCTGTVSGITVGQPAAVVSGTTVVTNVACFGGNTGAINLTPTGGVGPYTFNWGGGVTTEDRTTLTAGTYSVTITDANGCTGTVSGIVVTQPAAAVSAVTVVTNIACFGGNTGAINLTPTGGVGPYTFNWGGGITTEDRTGLAAGTYTVTITDANGCTGTVSPTVSNVSAAALGGTATKTDVSCNGGSNGTATVSVTGGTTPYSYSWAPSGGTNATATGLAAGTYTVTVTDFNGCQITRTVTVNQPATALGGIITKTDISCNGGSNGTASVAVTGGTTPYSYSWSPSGGTNAMATGLTAGTYTVTVTDFNGCQITRTTTINQPAAALGGTISKTDISCNGGSNGTATVVVTGGTTPYSYSWSPSGGTNASATGLASGTYTVTVTDFNGCQITRTVTVNQPATALSAATGGGKTDVSCNGGANGTATVAPTGGTPPYTYSWSPSGGTNATATGLAAGTYTVTVTDNNACQATRSFTITQPTALAGTASKTDVSCNGGNNGTATVAVTGGTPSYTYSWAPSGGTAATATGLAAGTYTVTVTDANACQITRTVTVNQPAAALAGTASKTDVSCNGGNNGTATVAVTGGTPSYTYSWAPSGGTAATATGLAAGTYTVTVTDANACQITRTVTVNQPAAALGGTISKTDVSCNGGANGTATVSATGGTTPYSYSWAPSGGTNATASGLASGTYTVTVTDFNGCQITRTVTVNQPAALTATTSQTNVSCNGGANGTASVTATGGTGAYTYSWAPSGGTGATASGLSAGTYTVTITDANTCQITRTVTVTEPAALTATTSQTNVSCNGGANGSASVTVTGGTGAYTFSWAPSGGTGATASGLSAGTYTVTITDANTCQITRTVTVTEPAALTATTSQTNVSCNGGANGSASVTVTGGTGAYTYSWAPSGGTGATATGLTAGTYTVTITDANLCQITRTVTLTEPAALAATTSQINLLCNGGANGSASVTVTGGTGAYTYAWAPSGGTAATASGLSAGTYTVTITDANTCQITRTVTLTEPAALAATTTQTNVSCNGGANGSASVTATGGTGTYTYVWAPSGGTAATASGLAAGTYTVTIKDANLCQITRTVTITAPSAIAIVPSQTNVSCTGGSNGSASVGVSGGTGSYTFSWAPSGGTGATATGLAAGTYTVTVTDANSCMATQSFTITTVADTTPPTVVTSNITVPLTAGAATITAAQVNNGSTDNCGIASVTVSPSTFNCSNVGANTVTLTVTDNSGNVATATATVTITDPSNFCGLSVPEFGDIKMRLYPNPTNGMVTVEFSRDVTAEKIEVYSITGQLILSDTNKTAHSSRQFNMERFPSGVYLVKITTAQGTQVKRLMRE